MRSTEADIVFLQEVTGENVLKALKYSESPQSPHYEFLADQKWPYYAYGKNAVYPHGHHGNAILSHYPIESNSNTDISTNRLEQRGLLHCCVRLPATDTRIHCLCVHLNLIRRGRRKQLYLLEQYIENTVPRDSPLVLAGDFNDWRNRDVLSFASRISLTDAVSIPFRKNVRTFPAKFPLVPLDHIFVRGAGVIRSCRHEGGIWKKLSDHAPLSATIDLL